MNRLSSGYDKRLRGKARELAISLRWIQCVTLVNEQRQLHLRAGRVELHDSGDLNAEVSQENGAPKVALNTEFLNLLDLLNRHTVEAGYPLMIGGELDYDAIQMLFDTALRVTLKIAPRGLDPLASHLLERFLATTSHEQFRKHCSIPFSRDTVEHLYKGQDLDISQIKSKLDHMVQTFRNPGAAFAFHELQIRFLLFHELAHYFLGHLNQAISNDQEYEADHNAAGLLFEHIDRSPESAVSSIAPSALLTLFLHMNFVEDLIGLCARCTKFAMKEDFRPYVRQVHYDHPRAYNRVRRIVGSFPNKFNADHVAVALLMEFGIYHIKRCIQLGLVDLKNLKYYCRARAIEQTHRAFMSLLKNPEHKMQVVDKLEYSTGWDSDDLMPGPLATEVFEGDWNQTVF